MAWVFNPFTGKIDSDNQTLFWDRDAVNGYVYPKTLTDKVGIGTTTPDKSLSIKTSATDNAEVRLFSSTAGGHIDTVAGAVAGHLYFQPSSGTNVFYTSGTDAFLRITTGAGIISSVLHSNGNSYLGGGSLKVGKSVAYPAVKTMDIAGNLNYDQVADVSKAQHEGMVLTEGTGGTLAAGEWFYNVNFYTAEGENSTYNSGFSTVKITVAANAKVTIDNIPISTDPRVVGRKLYRSSMSDAVGNRPYFQYLFKTIADNTTTTYTDAGDAISANDYGYWKANTSAGVTYIDGVKFSSGSAYNTSFGVGVLQSLTRGNGNTGFGSYSLRDVSTGVNNTAFGHYANYTTTTGSGNIAIGYATLQGNTTGGSNVAVGYNALRNNSGYSYTANTAVGDTALGILNASNNYNTAIGYYAGLRNQGSYNTFVGGYAGNLAVAAATGDYNLVLGYEAGRSMGTGADKNILIGYQTELPTATSDSQLNIGNAIYATGLGVGNTPSATGKVGIGVAVPTETLTVNGTTSFGDVTTNYTKFESDGSMVMNGNATVWEDIQFPISSGKVPAANFPTFEAFTTNTEAYAFSVDDKIQLLEQEPPHGWKEGTNGSAHIHFCLKSANSSGANRFAKFELIFATSDYNGIWSEQAAITAETTIPNGAVAKQSYLLPVGTVTLTGLHIGSQITCRVRRIAATGGTEYADDVFITQVGCHVECDTIGSRTVASK